LFVEEQLTSGGESLPISIGPEEENIVTQQFHTADYNAAHLPGTIFLRIVLK